MPEETPTLIAITVQGKFNQSRDVVFQTTVPFNEDPKEIYKKFSKLCDVMDRREEFYLLKGLRISLERDETQLKNEQNKVADLRDSYEREFAASGRKGAFELRGQQKTNIENQQGALKALKDRIDKIKSEIAELEKLQKAYE